MKRIALGLAALAFALLASTSAFADTAAETQARKAADAWLALVDGGDYAASWKDASTLFRNATTEQHWEQAVKAARNPLGKVLSREFDSSQYATALPGAPDGDYVVIKYETSFEHKQSAVETVTPMLDKDGAWRVSGYYIK